MESVSAVVAEAAQFNPVLASSDVSLTEPAQAKMKELFKDVDDDVTAIRIFVAGGGCGGMGYSMTFTDQRTEFDTVLSMDGFDVLVDAVALNFLRGVEIDYVENGASGASFVFNNVFQAVGGSGSCGSCGASGGGGGGCG